jgi:hypothetical protein
MRGLWLIPVLLALSACGAQRALQPAAGKSLPVAPFGRADKPSATELLALPPQARPGRNVELHTRSEARTDDPFDLPPQE